MEISLNQSEKKIKEFIEAKIPMLGFNQEALRKSIKDEFKRIIDDLDGTNDRAIIKALGKYLDNVMKNILVVDGLCFKSINNKEMPKNTAWLVSKVWDNVHYLKLNIPKLKITPTLIVSMLCVYNDRVEILEDFITHRRVDAYLDGFFQASRSCRNVKVEEIVCEKNGN